MLKFKISSEIHTLFMNSLGHNLYRVSCWSCHAEASMLSSPRTHVSRPGTNLSAGDQLNKTRAYFVFPKFNQIALSNTPCRFRYRKCRDPPSIWSSFPVSILLAKSMVRVSQGCGGTIWLGSRTSFGPRILNRNSTLKIRTNTSQELTDGSQKTTGSVMQELTLPLNNNYKIPQTKIFIHESRLYRTAHFLYCVYCEKRLSTLRTFGIVVSLYLVFSHITVLKLIQEIYTCNCITQENPIGYNELQLSLVVFSLVESSGVFSVSNMQRFHCFL